MTETQIGLERLENWQRWACGGEYAMIRALYYPAKAAVAGQYLAEAGEVWSDDEPRIPVNERDAELVERFVKGLPVHLCRAVRFHYTGRPKHIGIPEAVIMAWVEQAARELMARKFHVVS